MAFAYQTSFKFILWKCGEGEHRGGNKGSNSERNDLRIVKTVFVKKDMGVWLISRERIINRYKNWIYGAWQYGVPLRIWTPFRRDKGVCMIYETGFYGTWHNGVPLRIWTKKKNFWIFSGIARAGYLPCSILHYIYICLC